jgi:hypothetical protein
MRTCFVMSWGETLFIHRVPVAQGWRFRVESEERPEISAEADGPTAEDAIRELTNRLLDACAQVGEGERP